jgi:hypothetical protein
VIFVPSSSAQSVWWYSYNPGLSTTYTPTNGVATIQTASGGSFTGTIAGETCKLQSADASFTYNASGTSHAINLTPFNQHVRAVVLTDNSVSSALYPLGANGILGYGVGNPASLPTNASLVQSFLPYVTPELCLLVFPSDDPPIRVDFTNAVCGIELNHKDDPVPDGILTMGAVDTTAYVCHRLSSTSSDFPLFFSHRFTGTFTNVLVPPDTPVSWSVPVDKLSASGTPYDLPGLLASVDILRLRQFPCLL